MSTGMQLTMGGAGRYTAMVRDGVPLVEGVIPLGHFTAMAALADESGVMSNLEAEHG